MKCAIAVERAWGLSGGLGFFGAYDPGLAANGSEGWVPLVAAERAVNPTLWWRVEVTHRGSSNGIEGVELATLGAGFRWQTRPSAPVGMYLEAYPTLFGLRWKGTVSNWVGDRESFDETRLMPGLVTGVGLLLQGNDRVSLSYGLRYVRSTKPRAVLHPLSQTGFMVGLNWHSAAE